MRRFVLQVILKLGRYAVLPVVAIAGVLLLAWLIVLDHYTIAALATAPIVFCVGTAALALPLGILLLPSQRDRNFRADETAAPGLWAIWKDLDRAFARSGRTLTIDDNFNASIMEQSRYAGLFRGFTEIPPVGRVETSAIDQLLSPETARELLTRFDEEWRKKMQGRVSVGR
jgi:hypothetical protein